MTGPWEALTWAIARDRAGGLSVRAPVGMVSITSAGVTQW
jgi:hypothetical protein